MRPLRATTATAPGNFFAWISPWRILPIRPSRSAERPTSSGRAEGSACAHTKEKETDSETTRTPRNRRMRASREERGCHFSRTIWKGRAGRLQNACSGRGVHRLEGPGALRVRRLLRTPQGAVELRLGSEPREHQSRSDDEMRRNGLSDSLEERIACLARASPEEDGLRIEQRGDGGDGRAQVRHHWPRGARQAAASSMTLDDHGESIALLELRAERDVHPPVEIAGADDPAVGIDTTRHGNAERHDARTAARQLFDLVVEHAQHGAHAPAHWRFELLVVNVTSRSRLADQDGRLAPADVDADEVTFHGAGSCATRSRAPSEVLCLARARA